MQVACQLRVAARLGFTLRARLEYRGTLGLPRYCSILCFRINTVIRFSLEFGPREALS